MSRRGYIILVGLAFVVAGLVVLNLPNNVRADMIYQSSLSETVRCGTAFSPNDQDDPSRAAACDDKVGIKQGIGFGLGGAGLLVFVAGLLVRTKRPDPQLPAPVANAATPGEQP